MLNIIILFSYNLLLFLLIHFMICLYYFLYLLSEFVSQPIWKEKKIQIFFEGSRGQGIYLLIQTIMSL